MCGEGNQTVRFVFRSADSGSKFGVNSSTHRLIRMKIGRDQTAEFENGVIANLCETEG